MSQSTRATYGDVHVAHRLDVGHGVWLGSGLASRRADRAGTDAQGRDAGAAAARRAAGRRCRASEAPVPGVPNGKYAMYDHDGNVVVSAKYLAGKYDGDHVIGSRANLRIEESFKAGVRRDARKIWQFWELVMDENYDLRGRLDGAFTIWRD